MGGADARGKDETVVLCMKWGVKYGPEYVNRLYGMVSRNLSSFGRFVCLTDDRSGIRSEVLCYPIPALPLPSYERDGGWRKLAAFSPEAASVLGDRVLYMDLDIVVVDELDPFLSSPDDFVIIRDWARPFASIGNSSVFTYRPSRSMDVFERYVRDHERITRRFRNEQEYLTSYMRDFGALRYWPRGWCASFKHSCIPIWPTNLWRTPRRPRRAYIVVFHGDPKQPAAIAGRDGWNRRAFLPCPWIGGFWRE